MLIRVPDDCLLSVGLLYDRVTVALLDAQNCVVVLPLALFQLELGGSQLLPKAWRLRRDLLQLAVLLYGLLPKLLVHLNVTLLQVRLGILDV